LPPKLFTNKVNGLDILRGDFVVGETRAARQATHALNGANSWDEFRKARLAESPHRSESDLIVASPRHEVTGHG